jgi:hypothetical protein
MKLGGLIILCMYLRVLVKQIEKILLWFRDFSPNHDPISTGVVEIILPINLAMFLVIFSVIQFIPSFKEYLNQEFITPTLCKKSVELKKTKKYFWFSYNLFCLSLIFFILYLCFYQLIPTGCIVFYLISLVGPAMFLIGFVFFAWVIRKWLNDLIGGS